MPYEIMKTLIEEGAKRYAATTTNDGEREIWKNTMRNRVDVFYTCDRLTKIQYDELIELIV